MEHLEWWFVFLVGGGLFFLIIASAVEGSKTADRITDTLSGGEEQDPYVKGIVVTLLSVGIIVGMLYAFEQGW